ncbi:MAG TPA: hypothetical protein PKE45_01195 [Caldilineaceae bacterium]|nr:hypothetical protein [Caldilineaceae bacterium]
MNVRRGELLLIFLAVLAVNWLGTMWWLSDGALHRAAASGSAQAAPQAAAVVEAAAAIPRTFSYQGMLRGADGNPLNGNVKITLRIYNVVSGGTALFTEVFNPVFVRAGVFSLVVGDASVAIPANLFDNEKLFLGIAVGNDAELTPRQRLHPVPWAMQASTAVSAVTAKNLAQGGGVPNIVTFGAGGAKEIAFAGGSKITDGQTGMTLSGNVTVGGALTVSGDWSAGAILDKGDSNGGANQRSTYPVSINRYVIESPDNGASPDTVPLDDALLLSLCQDEDGCTYTLGMRNWVPARGNSNKSILATVGPARFSISPTEQGKRWWSSRNFAGGGLSTPSDPFVAVDAQDGDGNTNHVARAWDCFFTEGKYVNGALQGDAEIGFGLLNWNADYPSTDMTCVLIIED